MDRQSLTIPAYLAATVSRRRDEPALGSIHNGQLRWRTWCEVFDDAAKLAAAMRAAGVAPGDPVAYVSENRYEWIITDLALHLAGAVHVPIHITLSGEQIAQQIDDCGARLVIAASRQLLAKFDQRLAPGTQVWEHDKLGERLRNVQLSEPAVSPDHVSAPDDLATILYTSGTTGRPRGVMLSQRNLATNAAAVASVHDGGDESVRLTLLPLSHIYARTCDLYTWVYRGSRLALAESRETLARDLQLVRPTVLNAVPYVYQRIAGQIRAAAPAVADQAPLLRKFCGGQIERLSCGGAPLAPDVDRWYAECGLPILAGYGLTEASPVVSASAADSYRPGSVGRPIPGVEVRLAADGEILVRSPGVMRGYWRDEAATAEVIRDGWLHTGDLGQLDADGYLFIRGRKKELIVLSTGKNVLPTRVENLLTASPQIEQVAVFGEGQSGLVALIVAAEGGSAASAEQMASNEQLALQREMVAAEITRCLRPAAQEEQVRKFVLLDRAFSIDRGELTPKLSLCRTVIERNFAAELATLGIASKV